MLDIWLWFLCMCVQREFIFDAGSGEHQKCQVVQFKDPIKPVAWKKAEKYLENGLNWLLFSSNF